MSEETDRPDFLAQWLPKYDQLIAFAKGKQTQLLNVVGLLSPARARPFRCCS